MPDRNEIAASLGDSLLAMTDGLACRAEGNFPVRLLIAILCLATAAGSAAQVSAAGHDSVQAAIDANPGKMIHVAAGDYVIGRALRITEDNTGLYGEGRIVQSNPEESILEIFRESGTVTGVRVSGLTFTRAEGREESHRHGVLASDCADLDLDNIRVVDNWSNAGTIQLQRCAASRVHGCSVINYKRVCVDDRTESDLYGYAFRVIDGTGITVSESTGIIVQDNRVIERRLFPTEETKTTHQLGQLTDGKRPMNKGRLAPAGGYANNWHQGSAIVVTSPEETDHILVTGNYIENAGQGVDIHADHVTCGQNIIKYAFIGIKCMHGSRNVIINGNNVSHMDLWGLVMLPGTASHPAEAATDTQPARLPNYTRGNIIANNIFSDFGFGYEYFNWKDATGRVISLESGQLAENPVMCDVIVQGNIVYDSGRDQVIENGVPTTVPPRYEYAVFIDQNPAPQGLLFSNNIFHPGSEGVSNVPLPE